MLNNIKVKMNMKNLVILCVIVSFLAACSTAVKKEAVATKYDFDKGTITVKLENKTSCEYELKIKDFILDKGKIIEEKELDLLKLLKANVEISKDLSLLAAQSNNELKVSLRCADMLDTTFNYRFPFISMVQDDDIQFSGVGAKLISKSASRSVDEELKRWLYRRHIVVDDTLYFSLRNNYQYLSKTEDNDFVTNTEIPVLHDIAGVKYNISSNIQTDYYAVVACQNQEYIDEFVENAVVGDYKNLSTSKSSLSCVTQKIESGYLCVFLIGINKDYSYQQVPIAIVAIDNTAPSRDYAVQKLAPGHMLFKGGIRIIIPENAPQLFGVGSVKVVHWDGNGLECNVTFSVDFYGDCKCITIQRRGELCYRQYVGGYLFKQEDKIFYAKDYGTTHRFSWKMHFDDGDNEIPVIVEDYHGNKSTYNVVVRAEFVRSNTSLIDIENNIFN